MSPGLAWVLDWLLVPGSGWWDTSVGSKVPGSGSEDGQQLPFLSISNNTSIYGSALVQTWCLSPVSEHRHNSVGHSDYWPALCAPIGHLPNDVIWLRVPECFEASCCIRFFFFEESLVRDTNLHYKDCSEMHSGSCSQMMPSCKCPINMLNSSSDHLNPSAMLIIRAENHQVRTLYPCPNFGVATNKKSCVTHSHWCLETVPRHPVWTQSQWHFRECLVCAYLLLWWKNLLLFGKLSEIKHPQFSNKVEIILNLLQAWRSRNTFPRF